MARHPLITLLTDFGTQDGYAAALKGVLLTAMPEATLVDITHEITPGDVLGAAFVLRQVFDCFPPKTVHLAVVDPGVGTDRRILAARYADQTVIAPDNGLISLLDGAYPLESIVSVRNEDYFPAARARIGRTFDGRDIMAPVAAAVAGGVALERLGPAPETFKLLELPVPYLDAGALVGRVLHVDRFGNCITNLGRGDLAQQFSSPPADVVVWAKGRHVGPIRATYGQVPPGAALALLNSMDLLEVAVNGGRAADVLALAVGDEVRVTAGGGAQ